jgi:excisionase family DNA binding protein
MKAEGAAETLHDAAPVKVMTVREVSAYLQVHRSTIYRLLKRRQIPAFQVGSDWRFNIEAIRPLALAEGRAGRLVGLPRESKWLALANWKRDEDGAGRPPESPMMGQIPNAIGDKQKHAEQ